MAPPSSSTARQPCPGITAAARKPTAPDPRLKPVNISVTSSERERSGTYSVSRVEALGMAAPRPTPVSRRSKAISVTFCEWAVSTVKTPNTATDSVSTVLRP
jgi:hypothetical protein